ncbi:O-glycosyl hydrolase [Marinoscillum furvescens DSM 4134]|uniref:O-glycosyl hydrolase n=2 Tax=Marinoscillum furvescens TaxID=1026 RepID=A0A3D9L9S8_MARFU|nr:O-glycosyl hydrolase [Marinoscillum furvescens DSM 4134]
MVSKRLGLVLLFATALSFGVVAQKQLVIDATQEFQPIDGFGASDAWRTQFVGENWPEHKREQIAELLFSKELDAKGNPKGIGLSVWRYYIGSGSTELGDSSDIQNEWRRSECFQNADGTYDWTKNKGQDWFLRAAKRHGVEKFLGFSIAAPVHMSINGKAYSIGGDPRMNIKPGKLDDYATYLVDVLEYYHQQGIAFDCLSPFNEPQWDWSNPRQEGTAATNEDIYLFVNYLSKALEKSRLETELLIGEAGKIDFLFEEHGDEARGDQIDAFFNPDSPLYLADLPRVSPFITGHSYFTTWPLDTQQKTREQLKSKLAQYPDLNYLQTEFCILEESPEVGSGHKRDLGMNTALYVARVIHSDLTVAQSQGWEWWTALTTFDYKDGLIYLDTGDPDDLFNRDRMKQDGEVRESKLLWAMGNYARFIRPGMVRIAANLEGASDSLQVSAYKDNSDAVIVINNHETSTITVDAPQGFQATAMYVTDDKRNLESVRPGRKRLQIPARSVVTLVGTID